MAHLLFFEKPGCAGNARQRALLAGSGHTLERRDLLTTAWTREALLAFLGSLPVDQWFNRSAPRVRSGEIVPQALEREPALALLLDQPLLIRRPLMQRTDTGERLVGFDVAAVDRFVGLAQRPTVATLEACAGAHVGAADNPCRD